MNHSFVRSLTVLADGQEVAAGCHLRLTGSESLSLQPGFFLLTAEDLPPSSGSLLSSAGELEVHAGSSVLASGTIGDVYSFTRQGKNLTCVGFSSGLSLWESSVSLSAMRGVRLTNIVRAVLALSGTDIPLAGFTGKDRTLPRAQSFFGRTADVLSLLAETAEAWAYLSPAGVIFSGKADRQIAVFLETTDLLSAPAPVSGHTVLRTAMVGWPFGARVRYVWEGEYGEGRILSRSIDADNVSGPWRCELLVASDD